MEPEKKFKLVDPTKEESDAFGADFQTLLAKYPDLKITTNITKKAVTIRAEDGSVESVFVDFPTVLVQKKEYIEEPIPSTNPEVNPAMTSEK